MIMPLRTGRGENTMSVLEVARPLARGAVRLAEHLNLVGIAKTAASGADDVSALMASLGETPSLLQMANLAGARQRFGQEALEVFAHGTTRSSLDELVKTQGARLSEHGGNFAGRFFAALKVDVAEEFAARSALRSGGEPGIVGLAIPKRITDVLERNRWMLTRKIDDRQGLETVFQPGAMNTLRKQGYFFDMSKILEVSRSLR